MLSVNTVVLDENKKPLVQQRKPLDGDLIEIASTKNDGSKHVVTKRYYTPVIEEIEAVQIRNITLKAFRMRLTQVEKRNIKLSDNVDIQIMADDLAASTFIGLDDSDLKTGLLGLGALNMLELKDGQTVEQRIAKILENGTQEESV